MNVIFLDFDGVIFTYHDTSKEGLEKRIKILGDMCTKYNCKVVIEAAAKVNIDEETLQTNVDWIKNIFDLFKKYDIECIGRTPEVIKRMNDNGYFPIWKEDEILLYLFRHSEIEHYIVIDDDDRKAMHMLSDLNKVRNHLVEPIFYSAKYPEEEGLLEKHIDEVGEKLKLDNEIRHFAEIKSKRSL